MIGVFIIPTGIEAEIGGHAGDGTPAVKLIAAACNRLITHPNAVNASDINEMPDNCFYVEGSMLDHFLQGEFRLRQFARPNRVLVVANPPLTHQTINAVNAARVTIGLDAQVVELKTPLRLTGTIKDGVAGGTVKGWEELCQQVREHPYPWTALAIHTPIWVSRDTALRYYRTGGVNPWGGVEAIASKLISNRLEAPVAHAPKEREEVEEDEELYHIFNETVDPRIAPEAVSICYLHCILKGLHRAPQQSKTGVGVNDVDFMVTPHGCWGPPHKACVERGIPIIVVKENRTCQCEQVTDPNVIEVENYWEAAGIVLALKAGVHPSSVRRPLA